jgi:cystathionine beta-lyase
MDKWTEMLLDEAFMDPLYGGVSPALFQTSLFVKRNYAEMKAHRLDDQAYFYSRGNNPTVNLLEHKLARLENGEDAKCFGSGMAAITAAIMSVVSAGDHVVCYQNAYQPTRDFIGTYLRRFGVEADFVASGEERDWRAAIRPNTRLFYLESPSSFLFEMLDLKPIAALAKERGIVSIMDNTWATPLFFNPLDLGVDLVVHSLSKYISGHSDVVGGVVIGRAERLKRIKKEEAALFGGRMSPFEALLALRGLRTLDIRMEQHQQSAMTVARMLERHPKVRAVLHPGLESHPQHEWASSLFKGYSGVFSMILDTDLQGTISFVDSLRLFQIGVSWGGFESLALPAAILDQRLLVPLDGRETDVSRSLVRLAVGLEEVGDLCVDIMQALDRIDQLNRCGFGSCIR